jgi:hypothetical protein
MSRRCPDGTVSERTVPVNSKGLVLTRPTTPTTVSGSHPSSGGFPTSRPPDMLKPFTTSWCDAALAEVRAVQVPHPVMARIQFETGRERWHILIENGRITKWAIGEIAEPDVEVRWREDVAFRILGRELRGNDAMLATEIVDRADGARYVGTPAPLNLSAHAEATLLPFVPGASLSVRYSYRDGPFGTVDYLLVFEDGRIIEERLAAPTDTDVHADVSYLAMAKVRAGDLTILEALEDGSVQGDLGPLAALAGISESREFHELELATGRHAYALGALGLFDANPAFAEAMSELAARSELT